MQIIADANPIISLLIRPGKPIDILLIEELELVAPELLFHEIESNKDEIIQKSNLTAEEINQFIGILKRRIRVIPEEEFIKCLPEAEEICPDEKDIAYFALALYLKCPIWSNEKMLKKQGHITIHATHELMSLFGID